MNEYALDIQNLEVSQGQFKLDDINIKIAPGEIVGLVGENGAGKSTLIQSILNLRKIKQGQISVYGLNTRSEELAVKKITASVLDEGFFYEEFSINQIANNMAYLSPSWNQTLFDKLLKSHQINKTEVFKNCSTGMKMKVKLFIALSVEPHLLLLDEPTTGLDPVSRASILDTFYGFMTDEKAILFSSHITSDIDKIADRVIFIHQGKIILNVLKNDLDENFGLLKLSQQDFIDLGIIKHLGKMDNGYQVSCLIDNKSEFLHEYPDFVVEIPTVEDILIYMTKGER